MPSRLALLSSKHGFWWYIGRRLLWACFVVYTVMTAVFVLVVQIPDPERTAMLRAALTSGRSPEEVDIAEPPPTSEQYVDWLGSFFRLDWGQSDIAYRFTASTSEHEINAAVAEGATGSNAAAVAETLSVTLAYVVPATLLAFCLALVLGYYSARRPRSLLARIPSGTLYVLFSLPNFFIAAVIFLTLQDMDPSWFPSEYDRTGFSLSNVLWLALPTFVLSTHLLAGYFRYSYAETRDSLNEQFVTLAQSKGAHPLRVARHVFRKAAVPLVTLFITELVGVLLVTVFVIEVVFEVPGIGLLAYEAVQAREIELVMVITVLFAILVVLANLLQDFAAIALDARIDP